MPPSALVHILVAIVALIAARAEPPGPIGILTLSGFFITLWLLSAGPFRKAAVEQLPCAEVWRG